MSDEWTGLLIVTAVGLVGTIIAVTAGFVGVVLVFGA